MLGKKCFLLKNEGTRAQGLHCQAWHVEMVKEKLEACYSTMKCRVHPIIVRIWCEIILGSISTPLVINGIVIVASVEEASRLQSSR